MARSDVLVSADWAESNLETSDVVFVEVDEDASAYDGGHIAGAVKLDWKTDLQDPVKTAKLAWTMRRLLEHGITAFKCATPRELEVLCALGAGDVLVALERRPAARGHLEVAQWLAERFHLTGEDARSEDNGAFREASNGGHHNVVQWLEDHFHLT